MSAVGSAPPHGAVGSATPGTATGLGPAFTAARARLGLIALLFGLAALAWWSTADRMQGMDAGPGTGLGSLGWFVSVWVVMMAAMMLPALAPTVALYAQMSKRQRPGAPLLFVAGYLVVWSASGVLAYGVWELGRAVAGDALAWDSGGRWFAGSILVLAGAYELTPLKEACLGKCRSPLGFLLGNWRDGRGGAVKLGARHGAWCVGCCWALMAALFALGVMSLAWMAFVAALIALEKSLPWERVTYAVALTLVVLGIVMIAAPAAIPGLTVPSAHPMDAPSMSMS